MAETKGVTQVTVPWRAIPVIEDEKSWLAVVDPERHEICRILFPDTTETQGMAKAFADMIAALPWLMMAAKRTLEDLDRMEGLKNGVTVRQWVRNYEGARRRAELRDAVERAWTGSTKPPPVSYGIN